MSSALSTSAPPFNPFLFKQTHPAPTLPLSHGPDAALEEGRVYHGGSAGAGSAAMPTTTPAATTEDELSFANLAECCRYLSDHKTRSRSGYEAQTIDPKMYEKISSYLEQEALADKIEHATLLEIAEFLTLLKDLNFQLKPKHYCIQSVKNRLNKKSEFIDITFAENPDDRVDAFLPIIKNILCIASGLLHLTLSTSVLEQAIENFIRSLPGDLCEKRMKFRDSLFPEGLYSIPALGIAGVSSLKTLVSYIYFCGTENLKDFFLHQLNDLPNMGKSTIERRGLGKQESLCLEVLNNHLKERSLTTTLSVVPEYHENSCAYLRAPVDFAIVNITSEAPIAFIELDGPGHYYRIGKTGELQLNLSTSLRNLISKAFSTSTKIRCYQLAIGEEKSTLWLLKIQPIMDELFPLKPRFSGSQYPSPKTPEAPGGYATYYPYSPSAFSPPRPSLYPTYPGYLPIERMAFSPSSPPPLLYPTYAGRSPPSAHVVFTPPPPSYRPLGYSGDSPYFPARPFH